MITTSLLSATPASDPPSTAPRATSSERDLGPACVEGHRMIVGEEPLDDGQAHLAHANHSYASRGNHARLFRSWAIVAAVARW